MTMAYDPHQDWAREDQRSFHELALTQLWTIAAAPPPRTPTPAYKLTAVFAASADSDELATF